MAKGVRRGVIDTSLGDRRRERRLHRLYRLTVELNEMLFRYTKPMPSTKMRKELRWYRDGRLSLLSRLLALCKPIEDPTVEIDERAPFFAGGRGGRDGTSSRAGVKPDQNETGKVA